MRNNFVFSKAAIPPPETKRAALCLCLRCNTPPLNKKTCNRKKGMMDVSHTLQQQMRYVSVFTRCNAPPSDLKTKPINNYRNLCVCDFAAIHPNLKF